MSLGWRPHDIDKGYLPFGHGFGSQVGLTDPVFMAQFGLKPYAEDDFPEYPYDPEKLDKLIAAGDEKATQMRFLGVHWAGQTTSGIYKTWEDLKFIKQHWDGPLVLKGILSTEARVLVSLSRPSLTVPV